MFRALSISSTVIHIVKSNGLCRNRAGWQSLTTVHRLCSKKCERHPDKTPPEPPECKPPKPMSHACKPMEEKHPCGPPKDPCLKRPPLTSFQDCPKPNLMDQLPKPDCPYEKEDSSRRTYYRNILLLGTLIFLGTCGVVYFVQMPTKKQKVKKSKPKPVSTTEKPAIVVKKRVPANSGDIPNSVPYLLIGGGTASFSAFRAIKSADPEAKVLVIGSETEYPYMRPPLSKEIWYNPDDNVTQTLMFKQWNGSERSIFYEPDDFYTSCEELPNTKNGGVAVAQGWTVNHIDVVNRQAYLDDGYVISYDKCLVATGALPRNLDIFQNASKKIQEKVSLYRNVHDFRHLHRTCDKAKNITIIGGGFLGSELACSLAKTGGNRFQVYQIFKEGGNMGKILPEYLSFWTSEKIKKEGVEIIPFAEVTGAKLESDERLHLSLSNGESVVTDHVIVAIGVEPNTELAEKSDLEVDPELGGFLVNTELQARSHLYIAGDCACFYDTKLGRRRVEHHDHAVVSGRLAGENMTGAEKPYWHQSMFWSDLGPDVGYEAIGIVDSSLPTVGVFAKATSADSPKGVVTATDEGIRSTTEEKSPPDCRKFAKKNAAAHKKDSEARRGISQPQEGEDFGKGVIFYLRDDIVVGIVLWNVFNRMNIARQVLKDERKYDDLNEVAKLFNIHDEE